MQDNIKSQRDEEESDRRDREISDSRQDWSDNGYLGGGIKNVGNE